MSLLSRILKVAPDAAAVLSDGVRQELRDQGHVATGALDRGLRPEVTYKGGALSLSVVAPAHIDFVNKGTRPRFVSRKQVDALETWVGVKMGITGRKARGIAFAIARKHVQEGSPTRASYRFSKNGRRLSAVKFGTNAVIGDALKKLDLPAAILEGVKTAMK